jgi:hypothetical protein
MNKPRQLLDSEKQVIIALLQFAPDYAHLINTLEGALVDELDDGKMGGLRFLSKGGGDADRKMGRQIVAGEFNDSDGTLVSITLNVDSEGRLFELDSWKVDFSPLIAWPSPSDIKLGVQSKNTN